MSTIKVANVHFESTGSNRIDYVNDSIIRLTPVKAVSITSGNVLIGKTVDSTTGKGVLLDIVGSANASQYYANGILVTDIANSYSLSNVVSDATYTANLTINTNRTLTTLSNVVTFGTAMNIRSNGDVVMLGSNLILLH